jgi:hypothetical protein
MMQRQPSYEALQRRSVLRPRAPRRASNVPPPVVARVRAALLLRRARPPEESELVAEARAFALSIPAPVRLQVCVSLDGAQAYVYAWMEAAVLDACPPGDEARSARLAPLSEWQGASAAEHAPYHYVVVCDVDAGREADFNRWYDAEHMPRLSAEPGAVHCARLTSRDSGPRYHACYDLTGPDVPENADCPYSSNPRRILFRTLVDERRLAVSSGYF